MKNKQSVIILVFIDGEKVLTEKRLLENYADPQLLIPGGMIEDSETEEEALIREASEELGVIPLEYARLPVDEDIRGLKNQLLVPFFIKRWEGAFPEIILDKGNKLEWLNIDKVLNSPIIPTRKVVEALKVYLKNDSSKS